MSLKDKWLDDGFGNCWIKCDLPDCALEIVRPGKVQCEHEKCGACDWAKKHCMEQGDADGR